MPGDYPKRGLELNPIHVIFLISLGVGLFLVSYLYSLFIIGLDIVARALSSVMKYGLSLILKPPSSSNKSKTLLGCLVRPFLTEEEEEYIVGDLREEFSQFPSRRKAYVWLSKQVLTSILPLLGKNLKTRLASYFGKWIH